MAMAYGGLTDRGTIRALQLRFGVSPDFTLSLMPEIAGVIPFDMPELLYHQGWRRWQRGGSVAAVAAQNGQARIGNPDTSNRLMVVEAVIANTQVNSGLALVMGTAVGSTSLGTLLTGADFRDSRHAFSGGMAQISTTTTAAPFTPVGLLISALSNVIIPVPGSPWVLLPGSTLTIQDQTVNDVLNFTFVWRERLIQEQENTP